MTDPASDSPRDVVAGVVGDRILTVPNALSVVRLLGVPVFLWLLLGEQAYGWALVLLLLSGATDWLDGKLARLLDQSSALGALLDPFVDRLYVVTTLVGFALAGILPWWVAVVLIARDGILALTLLLYRRRGLAPPEVIYLGKAATFVLMSALPFLLAARVDWVGADVIAVPAQALLVWGTALYLYTGALYLGLALGPVRRLPLAAR
ncbi:CDP-alcohol phosphatidyltransferase family protein [Rhodococcus sp. BP-349]|uniref:CDP-alcohol phosphatidyltransferase family protein n=1 Tax=unclassified Rhodococcus (in: high G+C Gram-positive bacteria) TaxID=192944 RepID=UPI001C9A7594|nr:MULTISPECIES: CDP-alcohol phosphatidyltransferase family protein [unclassified Rhodococcus (in: high G+C Gram-positive bacteria)]MBY6541358.1 CDP-alcohol phosphatidyltransferase family protein [Rhodococcus sp. BP-363]MBY6544616.1 CDP-alcohol phosphatidyltransferase family protein [Rhodococcus sp. BP-369]MBY6563846.1 CDP-alcohol phosphatidyltransferase family protein [Rhodococcus sp. BP-370]MBY6579217.1 CDP-alcohol phosphatidyltransferase family protein [Rhodococcus sp. BP-364]MBY6588518.1 C